MKKKVEDILSEDNPAELGNTGELDDQERLAVWMKRTLEGCRDERLNKQEQAEIWSAITDRIEKNNIRPASKKQRLFLMGSVAALLLFAIGVLSYLVNKREEIYDIQMVAKINRTYLSDGKEIQLLDGDKRTHKLQTDSLVNQDMLKHVLAKDIQNIGNEAISYNSIGVPYGKRSEILLEDGTKVWLNAGSVLTFPQTFGGNQREVYIEGEAYFEVAKDPNRPFFVVSDLMKIQVLGTSFNVSAYQDDDFASTVLLTGNIAVLANNQTTFERQLLKPGMELRINRNAKTMVLHKNQGLESVSWTKKRLLLNGTNTQEIIRKLERFYNTDIDDISDLQMDETFSGGLDLTQSLPDILKLMYDQSKYVIKQEGRRIYIQKK